VTTFLKSPAASTYNLFEAATDADGDAGGRTVEFVIRGDGNVGIGTTTPVSTLSIQGFLCVRNTGSCGTTAGTIYATTATITDIDLAENYPTLDPTLSPGEIVALEWTAPATIKRASTGDVALGIISTKPGILLGKELPNSKPVALKGRVPVKVNMEGGVLRIGDRIALSSVPGIGTKATTTARTVGIALQDATAEGMVEVFIENQLTFANLEINALGELAGFAASTTPAIAEGSFMDGFLKNIFAQLTRWLADAANGIGEVFARVFNASEKICVDGECLTANDIRDLKTLAAAGGTVQADSASNGASETQQESDTQDTEPPTITIQGNNPAYVELGATYSDHGVIVFDNVDQNLGHTIYVDGVEVSQIQLDTASSTTYTIEYTAVDQAGNTATATRTVIVGGESSKSDGEALDPAPEETEESNSSDATSTSSGSEGSGEDETEDAEQEAEEQGSDESKEEEEAPEEDSVQETEETSGDTDTASTTPDEV